MSYFPPDCSSLYKLYKLQNKAFLRKWYNELQKERIIQSSREVSAKGAVVKQLIASGQDVGSLASRLEAQPPSHRQLFLYRLQKHVTVEGRGSDGLLEVLQKAQQFFETAASDKLADDLQKVSLADKSVEEADVTAEDSTDTEADRDDLPDLADDKAWLALETQPFWSKAKTQMEANLKKGGYGQMLTPARQNALYLGNIVPMIEEISKNGKHELDTRGAKKWLQRHPADVPGEMQRWLADLSTIANREVTLFDEQITVDHIIPRSIGGHNHPLNYYLMWGPLNSHFNGWWKAEKVAYIGAKVVKTAREYTEWFRDKAKLLLDPYDFITSAQFQSPGQR